MKLTSVTVLLAVALQPVAQGLLRALSRSGTSTDALSREASSMEAEEVRFFSSEFSAMQDELARLAVIAQPANSTKPANSTAVEPQHHKSLIPKHPNLNPKSVADLIPQLAMLKSLYEDGKERIAKLNKREKENQKKWEDKEAEHKAKLAKIEARFANKTLSLEFRTNETRDETNLFKYWDRCHQRQHAQYRTGLRIQHATLEKVKKMIDMYEKTISGDATKVAQAKKELKRVAPPEIVFLQTSVEQFCSQAIDELKSAQEELRAQPAALTRPVF